MRIGILEQVYEHFSCSLVYRRKQIICNKKEFVQTRIDYDGGKKSKHLFFSLSILY